MNTDNGLPVPIDAGFLKLEMFQQLREISAEITHTFEVVPIRRTETEARVSVLDDVHHPTRASKWWQATREQAVEIDQIYQHSLDWRRNELNIKKVKHVIAVCPDPFTVEEAQINLDDYSFRKVNIERVVKDRIREVMMWSRIKSELDDGTFDTTNPDTHQLISYTTRWCIQSAHSNKAQMSIGELNNLAGQLQAGLRRCKELGVLEDVLKQLPLSAQKDLRDSVKFIK